MKQHDLEQGSPAWHTHRATHFNASDAPAMMGCSKYKTRSPQLLHELHTGVTPEVDASQQFRFDEGHRFEALARPLGEQVLGEDLYPVVGTEGELSASFDGLTMDESIAFEHKSLNDELRAVMTDEAVGYLLPLQYRVQMEQQCMVADCEKVLFMASKWDGDELVEERHCWYYPDPALRAQIIAGWAQFAQDLAAYVPPERAAAVVVAEPMQALPAVVVKVTGEIVIHENFDAFEKAARDFLEHRLIREPKSDQDFADLDQQIKAMKGAEAALEAAESGWIAQIDAVSTAKQRKDMLSKLMRENRLMAERLLKDEKERRRGEIVAGGVSALRAHIDGLNTRLGKPYMPMVQADFGGAVKGLKSLQSMEDKVDGELTRAKIEASGIADRIQINLATLRELAGAHTFLFPDTAQIVLKAADDLTALAKNRIAEHDEKERVKAEQLRAKIAEEERLKAEAVVRAEQEQKRREEEAEDARLRQQAIDAAKNAEAAITDARETESMPAPLLDELSKTVTTIRADVVSSIDAKRAIVAAQQSSASPATAPALSLGKLSTRLGFTVTADFLRSLGFEPAGRERAAVLYHEADFAHICAAIVDHIQGLQAKQAA